MVSRHYLLLRVVIITIICRNFGEAFRDVSLLCACHICSASGVEALMHLWHKRMSAWVSSQAFSRASAVSCQSALKLLKVLCARMGSDGTTHQQLWLPLHSSCSAIVAIQQQQQTCGLGAHRAWSITCWNEGRHRPRDCRKSSNKAPIWKKVDPTPKPMPCTH